MKALIAEDSSLMREILGKTLGGMEFDDVLEAGNGDAAWETIRAEEPGLVLLDLRMPGRDGLEILSSMKEDDLLERCTVMVITGDEREETREKAMELGAAGYITKPVSQEELVPKIESVLKDR